MAHRTSRPISSGIDLDSVPTGQAHSPRSKYTIERHNYEQLRRDLSDAETSVTRMNQATRKIYEELESQSKIVSHVSALVRHAEVRDNHVTLQKSVIKEIASIALQSPIADSDKSHILSLCGKVGVEPERTFSILSVTGLPRLRIFSDEQCEVRFSVMSQNGGELFVSSAASTARLGSSEPTWGTDLSSDPVKIPMDLFSAEPGPIIGVMFESSVIARTSPLSLADLQLTKTIPLFHDDIPIKDCHMLISADNGLQSDDFVGIALQKEAFELAVHPRDG